MTARRPRFVGIHRGRSTTPDDPRDRGQSLVEVVVAVVLLAVVAVPVLMGLWTVTRASAVSTAASNVETALINAVDRVNRADAELNQLCDYTPYARAAVLTQGWTAAEVSVTNQHYDVDAGVWAAGGCPSGLYQSNLVQRVTITVRDPNRHVSRSIQVVKSNV